MTSATLLLLAALSALPPVVHTTTHLEVRAAQPEAQAAIQLGDIGEAEMEGLNGVLGGWPPGGRITLVVTRNNEALRAALGPGVPEWAAGVAFPPKGITGVHLAPRSAAPWNEIQATLRHELSHVLLYRAAGDQRLPRWFTEGFAILHAKEFSFERARVLLRAAMTDNLLTIDSLERRFPSSLEHVTLAYAQAVSFVAFLLDEDATAFAGLLAAMRGGATFTDALAVSYRRPISQLERAWTGSLERDYRWVPLVTGGTSVWTFATILFLVGYVRRRRERAATLKKWGEDESRYDAFRRTADVSAASGADPAA